MWLSIVNKCSAVAEMGDRLTTIDMGMGRKWGGYALLGNWRLCPFWRELGPI